MTETTRRTVTIAQVTPYPSSSGEPRFDLTFTDGTTARTSSTSEIAFVLPGFCHGQTLEGFFERPDRLTWARVAQKETA